MFLIDHGLMRLCRLRLFNYRKMKLTTRRTKYISVILILITFIICHYVGIYAYLFSEDYFTKYSYPFDGNIDHYIDQIKSGKKPNVEPITIYNYSFLLSNDSKCVDKNGKTDQIRLLIVVKSAVKNRANRDAIRESWGWEHRFSDVNIRTVFLLGVDKNHQQQNIEKEHDKHGDIVQSDFIDTYFNNTIKTMQGFKWVVKKCPNAEFILFSDDDFYISVKNVLRFIRNPLNYPLYLTRAILQEFQSFNIDETSELLFSGYVFFCRPLRHKFSKWRVTLDEYPFSRYPPYVSAGSYVLSREALSKIYYTSLYTKHYRFDDVYLGMVAKKAGIIPLNNENFHFWKKSYDKFSYKYVISSHGYENVNELLKIWHEQRSLGNA